MDLIHHDHFFWPRLWERESFFTQVVSVFSSFPTHLSSSPPAPLFPISCMTSPLTPYTLAVSCLCVYKASCTVCFFLGTQTSMTCGSVLFSLSYNHRSNLYGSFVKCNIARSVYRRVLPCSLISCVAPSLYSQSNSSQTTHSNHNTCKCLTFCECSHALLCITYRCTALVISTFCRVYAHCIFITSATLIKPYLHQEMQL